MNSRSALLDYMIEANDALFALDAADSDQAPAAVSAGVNHAVQIDRTLTVLRIGRHGAGPEMGRLQIVLDRLQAKLRGLGLSI